MIWGGAEAALQPKAAVGAMHPTPEPEPMPELWAIPSTPPEVATEAGPAQAQRPGAEGVAGASPRVQRPSAADILEDELKRTVAVDVAVGATQ